MGYDNFSWILVYIVRSEDILLLNIENAMDKSSSKLRKNEYNTNISFTKITKK